MVADWRCVSEKRTDMYISNLRRYVEVLGGQLKITAVFPEGEVAMDSFRGIEAPPIRRRAARSA